MAIHSRRNHQNSTTNQRKSSDEDLGLIRDNGVEEDEERLSRAVEDDEREAEDGTVLSMAERKRLLRKEWTSDILPEVKDDSGFWHYCWLTTTNTSDPIYKRLQLGYELVKYEQMPKLGVQNQITAGEFAGCVSINEMILARIPSELYQELMLINHHERPLEEEELLKANLVQDESDSEGNALGQTIGTGHQNFGRRVKRPTF